MEIEMERDSPVEPPVTPANVIRYSTNSINFSGIRQEIINNEIIPALKYDINNDYVWRFRWNMIARITGAVSQALTGVGSIFSFVATSNNNLTYAFIAGIFGVVAIFMTNFSSYSEKQRREKTTEINKYLEKLNLKFSLPNSNDGKTESVDNTS